MASCGGLEDRLHFPSFAELPLADDYSDAAYYVENSHGMMVPIRSWCFFAEIVDDSLSHAPEFFHRVEVRDATGCGASVLFGDGAAAGASGGGGDGSGHGFDFGDLVAGRTLFVRYATKFYFSDLTTQVLRVEDAGFVKVIDCGIDALLSLGQYYLSPLPAPGAGQVVACMSCGSALSPAALAGVGGLRCGGCGAGRFCGEACRAAFLPVHVAERHCEIVRGLEEVLSLDWERFVEPVKFSHSSSGGGRGRG
jgi:hypothetical protein